jgi:hypothetical protein
MPGVELYMIHDAYIIRMCQIIGKNKCTEVLVYQN